MARYVISDTHFGHARMMEEAFEARPFDSVEEMDAIMVANWNKVVGNDDVIYHLGDFALSSRKRKRDLLEELNGYKILIMGNHDKWRGQTTDDWRENGFDKVYRDYLILDETYILSHRPIFADIPAINFSVENWDYRPVPFPTATQALQLCGHSHSAWIIRENNVCANDKNKKEK